MFVLENVDDRKWIVKVKGLRWRRSVMTVQVRNVTQQQWGNLYQKRRPWKTQTPRLIDTLIDTLIAR
jgi:hypothetical protein